MSSDYLPLLILFVLAAGFAAVAIIVPSIFGPQRPSQTKLAPIESGMIPFHDAQRRFPVQYYVVAVLFILFDVEVVFLYPWAILLGQLKVFGLLEMGVFLLILLVGYFYVWRKGALDW